MSRRARRVAPNEKKRTAPKGRERSGLALVSEAVADFGRSVGRRAAELVRSVDPDVARHLLQLPLLSYSLFASKTEPLHKGKPDGRRPVVFVHGLGGSRGDFLPMSAYLWTKGHRRLYRIHFQRGQSIPQMTKELARFVRRVSEKTGEPRVDLVAHSLGGLVSRAAILDERLSNRVGTLVTLGSPHRGTHSARFANTAVTRDLRPGSTLLVRLDRKRWPKEVRALSFWSRNDVFILPAEAAIARGARAVEMTPFTHYSYLLEPKSWAAVKDALQRGTMRTRSS